MFALSEESKVRPLLEQVTLQRTIAAAAAVAATVVSNKVHQERIGKIIEVSRVAMH
jgi:hypothetical protein